MYRDDNYQGYPQPGDLSAEIELDELDLEAGDQFGLHYDFGDDWMFHITVQKMTKVSETIAPRVIKEKGKVEQYPDWEDEWEEEEVEED